MGFEENRGGEELAKLAVDHVGFMATDETDEWDLDALPQYYTEPK